MKAPEKFAAWMAGYRHTDRRYGHVYLYHSRSDAHSIALCRFILEDLLDASELLREHAAQGKVAYGINVPYTAPSGKRKNLDLAIGRVERGGQWERVGGAEHSIPVASALSELIFSCEAKSVMTEHKKSQPRVYDELSSSHEIVHQAQPTAIATGVTIVNIAQQFVSPLRQTSTGTLHVSEHRQPYVANAMISHLRGLSIRDGIGAVGFDAYSTIVVDCDNQTYCSLRPDPPAPQKGDRDHYDTFVDRVVRLYSERFAGI